MKMGDLQQVQKSLEHLTDEELRQFGKLIFNEQRKRMGAKISAFPNAPKPDSVKPK